MGRVEEIKVSAWTLHDASLIALRDEVARAREKFPGSRFLLSALMEETGELAQAFLQRLPQEERRREALQVACVAMRIYEEGDPIYDELTDEESKP